MRKAAVSMKQAGLDLRSILGTMKDPPRVETGKGRKKEIGIEMLAVIETRIEAKIGIMTIITEITKIGKGVRGGTDITAEMMTITDITMAEHMIGIGIMIEMVKLEMIIDQDLIPDHDQRVDVDQDLVLVQDLRVNADQGPVQDQGVSV